MDTFSLKGKDGFSLANHGCFAKFPKLFHCQILPLCGICVVNVLKYLDFHRNFGVAISNHLCLASTVGTLIGTDSSTG